MKSVLILANLWCIGYGYRVAGFSRSGVDGGGGSFCIGSASCPGHDSIHTVSVLGDGGCGIRRRDRNRSGLMMFDAVHKYGRRLCGSLHGNNINGMSTIRVRVVILCESPLVCCYGWDHT